MKGSDILEPVERQGKGVETFLNTIIEKIRAPKGDPKAPLRALIFDSVFNSYRGIISYFRIFNVTLNKMILLSLFRQKRSIMRMK
jgi:GTP-binding protein LepA